MTYRITADHLKSTRITIDLPASKSLSNRALILSALCDGKCRLEHLSDCDDTRVMLSALKEESSSAVVSPRIVDIGAAGTSMRFLTAYFAQCEGAEVIMTGTDRMKQRPIGILVDALRALGADIEYAEQEGFPPLRISGRKLRGGKLSMDGSTSSQYISAILMIAPKLNEGLELTLEGEVTSRPYIDMTLRMMEEFGVKTSWTSDLSLRVDPQSYRASRYAVESDWSAASYWYQICLLATDMLTDYYSYLLKGLKAESLQGDSRIKDLFAELGVKTQFTGEGAIISHIFAKDSLPQTEEEKKARDAFNFPDRCTWNLCNQPDLAQTMIATCCAIGYPFDISGLHTLRIKETDRLAAMQTELAKFGYSLLIEGDDRMSWDGTELSDKQAPIIDTYHDHRMAMSLAPMAVFGDLYICNPEVVSKSYPAFWDHLRSAGFSISEVSQSREQITECWKENAAKQERIHRHAKCVTIILLVAIAILLLGLFFL